MSPVFVMLLTLLGADAQLDAPATAKVGEFVLIDATGSTGQLTWAVSGQRVSHFVGSDSRQLVIHAQQPGFVKVRLTATDAAGKSSDVDVIEFTGDGKPLPAPAPMPDKPQPPPPIKPNVLPDGRFKLATPVRDEAARVKTTDRQAEAALIATKLADISGKLKTGSLSATDPAIVMKAIQQANGTLPRDVQQRWGGWGQWWGRQLYDRWKAGQVQTASDWAAVIDETCLGLKAVQ